MPDKDAGRPSPGTSASSLVEESVKPTKARTGRAGKKKATKNTPLELSAESRDNLAELLRKSAIYSSFVADTIEETEQEMAAGETAGEPEAAEAPGTSNAPGSKRKAGPAKACAGKRSKVAAAQAAPAPLAAESEEDLAQVKAELCPLIVGDLREYQLKGIRWLVSLYKNGFGGILADQMGLGKTVQTIGLLSHLRINDIRGPFLVVGPLTTVPNWEREVRRWCPSMNVLMYHGSKAARAQMRRQIIPVPKRGADGRPGAVPDSFPVICTSFEICMTDLSYLKKFAFKYLIVDEGHRLKNMQCKLMRCLRELTVESKLLLTGTPLQNNLTELWSLLNFVLPTVFHSQGDFQQWFNLDDPAEDGEGGLGGVEKAQRAATITQLHAILKPFLLRRIKSDVESTVPRKMEVVLYARMTPHQRSLNSQLLNKTIVEEMRKTAPKKAELGKLRNMLMQMRKNCNHPDLITGDFSGDPTFPSPEELEEQCGKMQVLSRVLRKLRSEGRKVLIFSQMTKMLDLLDWYLAEQDTEVCRIDGSMGLADRQAAIDVFNDKDNANAWVFLLSTRAGGLGINLTAADTVIIYDSDWNPHQDLQAMDRVHRIGQTSPVLVLRLATANSVENRMLKRANAKLNLEKMVIKKGAFLQNGAAAPTTMDAEALLDMLKDNYEMGEEQQSDTVSDAMIDVILDRQHLLLPEGSPLPFKSKGPGYEVVEHETAGLLTGVNADETT